jgi:hypothetical protein
MSNEILIAKYVNTNNTEDDLGDAWDLAIWTDTDRGDAPEDWAALVKDIETAKQIAEEYGYTLIGVEKWGGEAFCDSFGTVCADVVSRVISATCDVIPSEALPAGWVVEVE